MSSSIKKFNLMLSCLAITVLVAFAATLVAQEKSNSENTNSQTTEKLTQDEIHRLLMDRIQNQRGELKSQRDEVDARRIELINILSKECGLSSENVKPLMLELEKELFTLKTTQAIRPLQTRILMELLHLRAEEIREREKSDKVLDGLTKIAGYHQELRSSLEKQRTTGAISEADWIKVNMECMEAEMRVAQHQQELAKTHNKNSIENLNNEIYELAKSERLDEVRTALLKEQLVKLRNVQEIVRKIEMLDQELISLSRKIDKVEEALLETNIQHPSK